MNARLSAITGSILLLSSPLQGFSATTHPDSCMNRDWKKEIPLPVYPNREMTELYHQTWEIAAGRVRKGPEGLPASPYMDENCYEDQIWIWDTCFMVLFAKYAPRAFPGSLDNLYKPIHEKAATPLRIHLVDNPPLFAWVEKEYFDFTGDKGRLNHLLNEKRYLQKHFKWFARAKAGERFECSPQRIYLNSIGDDGFTWTGGASGMDNTPRGRDAGGYHKVLWVDAISQQALSAHCIAAMEQALGNENEARKWNAEYEALKKKINHLYWDERDGFYYDVTIADKQPCRVKTIASYWPLLARIASREQARSMVNHLMNPWPARIRIIIIKPGITGGEESGCRRHIWRLRPLKSMATMRRPMLLPRRLLTSSLPLTGIWNRILSGSAIAQAEMPPPLNTDAV